MSYEGQTPAGAKMGPACRCVAELKDPTYSFLSLSPIPAFKLTDQGLVDAVNLKLTTLIAD